MLDACVPVVPEQVLEELELEESPIRNFVEISIDSSIQDIKEEI